MSDTTYLGTTYFRDNPQLFGVLQCDKFAHSYILGKTGTGKSSLIHSMILQDIHAQKGVCLIDPHGDLVKTVHREIPKHRKGDVLYFNFPDTELKLRYNPFRKVSYEKRALIASSILESMKKLWSDAWGVKLEHLLRNTILTLLDQPKARIDDIPKMLLDKDFRNNAVRYVQNKNLRLFWKKEFPQYNKYDFLPALNKVGGMLSYPVIQRALVDNPEEVSLRKAIDEKKIILVNLSKGHLGEDAAHILGALFISTISSAAFSRVDTDEDKRVPCMVYIDEFHNYTTLTLINMLSELRKFKVGMILAHQYLKQLEDDIKHAIIGNIGTLISFRIGAEDAQFIALEMYPEIEMEDLINLPNYFCYIKLAIHGKTSRPFSAKTILYRDLIRLQSLR